MSNMVEIDIDFDYCGEVEMVLAHDECGEHEAVEFYRNDLLASENAKLREQVARLFDKTLELGTENDRLREQLAKARDPQRIGGTADPESFIYAIEQLREFRWQHATNDEEAIPYINNVADAHERENVKLRKLVQYILDECYGDDWFSEQAEALGFEPNF